MELDKALEPTPEWSRIEMGGVASRPVEEFFPIKRGEQVVVPAAGRQTARRNLAELCIGTKPRARSVKSDLQAEKIMSTVHIAIGDNAHIGGVVHADPHEGFVLREPDLSLDGQVVIREGMWLV